MPVKGKLMHSLVWVTGYSCAGWACRVGWSVATGPWKMQNFELEFQAECGKSHSVMHSYVSLLTKLWFVTWFRRNRGGLGCEIRAEFWSERMYIVFHAQPLDGPTQKLPLISWQDSKVWVTWFRWVLDRTSDLSSRWDFWATTGDGE